MNVSLNPRILSNYDGYNVLISLYHSILAKFNDSVILDFQTNDWFEANLSSVLGGILFAVEEKGKKCQLRNLSPNLTSILQRNGFLETYGFERLPDKNGTIVTFRKFTPYKDMEFMDYIRDELLAKPDFPRHSTRLGKKINESIFELFENARTHGHCKNIFTCGQYYPTNKRKRLDMTIVDMGDTVKANVNQYLQKDLSGAETIDWAFQDGNTTKTGEISGGLGLGIIFEFIKLNNGKIQIISADGFWEYNKGTIETRLFDKSFPGTIANIEFNLEDKDYYLLTEEISLVDIF